MTFDRDFSEDGDDLSLDLCGVVGSVEENTIDRSRCGGVLIVDDGAGEDTMEEGVFLPVGTAMPAADLCSRGGEMKAIILPLCFIFDPSLADFFRDADADDADADLGLFASIV